MKVIIPAAGYATRLHPLTADTPKALLDIGSKKMIEHIIDKVQDLDEVDHILVVSNDRFYDQFSQWLDSYDSTIPISILNNGTRNEEERLGAIGDIHFAVKNMNIREDTLVIAGDNLFEFNLQDMIRFAENKNTSVIAARDLINKELLAGKFGVIDIDENHKILDFEEKPENPKTSITATMMYLFKADDLQHLHNMVKEGAPDNAGEFIEYLSDKTDVHSFIFDAAWHDIGSIEHLEEVSKLYE